MMAWALARIELFYQLFHQRGDVGEGAGMASFIIRGGHISMPVSRMAIHDGLGFSP